ncbi:DUF2971 domain-containing protein [Petrimonas mucosa]|uniref:DUF2971 domain-containing protein n=1 Tax=Petrimonas mucosa TaxID=1642646 RepID=UPI003C792AF0
MEGKLVSEILARIAVGEGLDENARQRIQKSVSGLEQLIDGLGFCLSEEKDLLSQWRGYAADATGVSIGFSTKYLDQLAESSRSEDKPGFSLQKVEYEPDAQESLIKPTYLEIKKLIDEDVLISPRKRSILEMLTDSEIQKRDIEEAKKSILRLNMTIFPLFGKFFLLKTRAFREEREWRLISYLIRTGDDTCSFRAMNDRIVPYREFELLDNGSSPILEVILGPKNTTPNYVIEGFLKHNAFTDVTVLRSEATYR